jgi:hypothetical protein
MADWTSLLGALNGSVLSAFGREVVYQPLAGGSATIPAIFEPGRQAEESAPGVYAALFVRLADLASPPVRGDRVSIDGVEYAVFDMEADAAGGMVLRLRRA